MNDTGWTLELIRMALENLLSGKNEVVIASPRRELEVKAWRTLDGVMLEIRGIPKEVSNAKA